MTQSLLFFAIVLFSGNLVTGQAITIFRGAPVQKISESGVERAVEQVPKATAPNLVCVVNKIGENYYWASRENRELVKIEAGAFITYIAIDGSGYIRIITPEMKSAAALLAGLTEEKFDYVEHLLIGLKSVTYYGITK